MKKTIGLLMLVAMVCGPVWADVITFQNGVNDYQGSTDSTIRGESGKKGNNYGAAPDIKAGYEASDRDFVGFSQWDFGSIPSGLTITSAKLKLYLRDAQATGSRTINVYPMLTEITNMGNKNGTEADIGEVTWYDRARETLYWGTSVDGPLAGTDYDNTSYGSSVTFSEAAEGTFLEFDVTDIVNAWYGGTLSNYGFLIRGASSWTGNEETCAFASVNTDLGDSYRPIIEITYEIPEPATMSLLALGGLGVLIRRKR